MTYALKLISPEIKFLSKAYSASFYKVMDTLIYKWNYFGEGDYWHSIPQIAKHADCSQTTAKKNIKLAVELGLIETKMIERNKSYVTSYHLHVDLIKSFLQRGVEIFKEIKSTVSHLTKLMLSTIRKQLGIFLEGLKKALSDKQLPPPPPGNNCPPYNIEYENIRKYPDSGAQNIGETTQKEPELVLKARSVSSSSPVTSDRAKEERSGRPSAALGGKKHTEVWIHDTDLDGLVCKQFDVKLIPILNQRINDALNASKLTTTKLSARYRNIPMEILFVASKSQFDPLVSINQSISRLIHDKWERPTAMPYLTYEAPNKNANSLKEILSQLTNKFC